MEDAYFFVIWFIAPVISCMIIFVALWKYNQKRKEDKKWRDLFKKRQALWDAFYEKKRRAEEEMGYHCTDHNHGMEKVGLLSRFRKRTLIIIRSILRVEEPEYFSCSVIYEGEYLRQLLAEEARWQRMEKKRKESPNYF